MSGIVGEPVRTRRLPMHLARNLVHYAGQFCWFLALALIPIAQVVAIEFTLPLWTAVLAATFLGEKLNASRIGAVVLGLCGIFLIMGPGVGSFSPGQAVALAAAMLLGSAIIITKSLTRTDLPLTIIFYMFFIQTVIGLPIAISVWQWPPQHLWPWVLVVGIAGGLSHFCLAKAISLADGLTEQTIAQLDRYKGMLSQLLWTMSRMRNTGFLLTVSSGGRTASAGGGSSAPRAASEKA